MPEYVTPTVPVSCGAILRDGRGRLLILEPTYKSGWTIPGGIMEAHGESPWDGCRREVYEETGLTMTTGRLAVVDTRPGKPGTGGTPLGLRFLFDCGTVTAAQAKKVRLQADEIRSHRFAPVDEALELLRGPVARRVAVGVRTEHCVYLENGRPVDGLR